MFRASSAHLQEDTVVHLQHMVLSLSIRVPGGLSVHSLSENWLWGDVVGKQRISTKKCCPCTVNIACHFKQSSNISFGGTLSWRWHAGMSIVRVVQTAITRILRHRFPGASETVGQVFKFVRRLHWKINAVCMSLSPLVSFISRFVPYLLNFPRNINININKYSLFINIYIICIILNSSFITEF